MGAVAFTAGSASDNIEYSTPLSTVLTTPPFAKPYCVSDGVTNPYECTCFGRSEQDCHHTWSWVKCADLHVCNGFKQSSTQQNGKHTLIRINIAAFYHDFDHCQDFQSGCF